MKCRSARSMRSQLAAIVVAAIVMALSPALHGQAGNILTYQGRLEENGAPANGAYHIQGRLWDAPVGGTPASTPQVSFDHPVVDGLFTVQFDFGAAAFVGGDRWLEIVVGTGAGATTLSPRQLLTSSPRSIQTRGVHVSGDSSFVGIGRDTPINVNTMFGLYRNTSGFGGMYVETNANGEPFYGYARNSVVDAYHYFDGTSNQWRLWAGGERVVVSRANGFVGIGTTTPIARLQVTGNGSDTVARFTNGGSGGGTALIVGDVGASGRAASFFGLTSQDLVTVQNAGTGKAAVFTGTTAFQGGNVTINNGNLGIGTTTPIHPLQVVASSGTAVSGQSGDTGVLGSTSGQTANDFGVFGVHPTGSSYGVFSSGNFAASGTKSFRIDHPLDPAYKYLIHYCAESPEPLNVYSGVVKLDANGEAWVDLPEYFEHINKDVRYQLTCIGGHANVYIAEEVRDNRFKIAGGRAGIKVSWEVKGVRNDLWVRQNGAPTEVAKPEHLQGLYQRPELYGLSQDFAEQPMPEIDERTEPSVDAPPGEESS